MEKTVTFELEIHETTHHITVMLFPTWADLVAHMAVKQPEFEMLEGALTGQILYDNVQDPQGEPKNLADVMFCPEHFGYSVIAHEMLHAAMSVESNVWGNRKLEFADYEVQERLCYMMQGFIDDMLFKMDELGMEEYGVPPAV